MFIPREHNMQLLLDLSEGERKPVRVEVLAILFHAGQRLYAVIGIVDGAPWYGLVHEHSKALLRT